MKGKKGQRLLCPTREGSKAAAMVSFVSLRKERRRVRLKFKSEPKSRPRDRTIIPIPLGAEAIFRVLSDGIMAEINSIHVSIQWICRCLTTFIGINVSLRSSTFSHRIQSKDHPTVSCGVMSKDDNSRKLAG